jgi:ABC-type Fe3+ transport system permease subunit
MVQNDMVVTNLFQVPTLCESVYQQVQFGKLRWGPIATACLIALISGLSVALIVSRSQRNVRSVASILKASWDPVLATRKGATWIVSILVWSIATFTVALPWLGMIFRIGIESRMIDGQAVRGWSANAFLSSLLHVQDYRIEIGWSCELVFWTSVLSMVLALGLITWIPFRGGSAWVLGTMVFLLALPGPIVNLSVSWLFNTAMPQSLQFLGDQTLLGPILALQTRCLPVAYGILWLARSRFEDQHETLLSVDRSLPMWLRIWIWLCYARVAILVSALGCGMIAFGDLASYLLVQPPGVTTVAMRMFELLHYGIRNREASLALLLSAFALLPSWWLARRIDR